MTEEFDTATSTGRLMLTMLSGFAAHDRELIRERSMAGSKFERLRREIRAHHQNRDPWQRLCSRHIVNVPCEGDIPNLP
jgi:DNA invertase Pin-like site-specific DNA recombinase